MNTIVIKHNNFSNAMQSFLETLYLKNPNLGIGGVHRWIQGGKWEGGAALRPTPNYEHEVAPPSSKTCNLKANFRNSIAIRFRVTFLRESREALCSSIQCLSKASLGCVFQRWLQGRGSEKAPHPILAHHLAQPHLSASPHIENCLLATHLQKSDTIRSQKVFFCCLDLLKNNDEKLAPHLNFWGPTYTQIWGGALKNVRALHARHNLQRPNPLKILSPHLVSSFQEYTIQ